MNPKMARAQQPVQEPTTLVDLLAKTVDAHAARPLFVTKTGGRWSETSYGDFAKHVDALRAALSELGVVAGDRVGIISGNCVEWAVAAYATYGLGAAFVPMYESQPEEEWSFIARDAELKVLFVANPTLRARMERRRSSLPLLEHLVVLSGDEEPSYALLLRAGAARGIPPVRPRASDPAALLYTSGTTGEPKGVVLTHGNIVTNVLALRDVFALAEQHPEEQRSLSFLPWAHALGHTCELHCSVSLGASIAIAESFDKIVENLAEIRPSVLVAVPRVFLRIYSGATSLVAAKPRLLRWLFSRGLAAAKKKRRGEAPSAREALVFRLADSIIFRRVRARVGGRLKYALSGGAALSLDVAEFVDAVGITVYEGYGLTETSPIATANIPGQRKLGSVGRPLPGVRIVIDCSVTSASPQGEIVVYGPNVMRGYHHRERETREAFTSDGGLRTGDMGYVDDDGYLFITGRIKEQYKLANGKYVVPSLLEERLKVSPFIANAFVYGENRAHNVALIVPNASFLAAWARRERLEDGTIEALIREPRVRAKIQEEIQTLTHAAKGYERIQAFALLTQDFTQENGMLTPSLKLRRRNVIERFRSELLALYGNDDGGEEVE